MSLAYVFEHVKYISDKVSFRVVLVFKPQAESLLEYLVMEAYFYDVGSIGSRCEVQRDVVLSGEGEFPLGHLGVDYGEDQHASEGEAKKALLSILFATRMQGILGHILRISSYQVWRCW